MRPAELIVEYESERRDVMSDNWSPPRPTEAPKSVFRTMLSVIRAMPKLPPEAQQAIIRVLEAYGPQIEAAENGTTIVDDATIRAIVAEQRHGVDPSSVIPQKGPARPVEKGSGWQKPREWEPSKAQTEIFDNMVSALAGGPNDTSKLR